MDSKDFQLLVALHQDARQSFQSLGHKVSLSAPAVRDRLSRLQRRGILQGFWLTPDPALFDREDLVVFFGGEWSRENAFALLNAPDVAWVAWKMDGGFTVQLWPHNASQAVSPLSKILGGISSSGQALSERSQFRPLSLIDWQIVDALFEEPRMPLDQLCARTQLSPKTVRKHLRVLTTDHYVYISPKMGPLSDSGELIYNLAVFGKVAAAELVQAIGDAYLVAQNSLAKYLLCRSPDLSDVSTKTNLVKKLANVESVVVSLNREQLIASRFIRSLIRAKILELSLRKNTTKKQTRREGLSRESSVASCLRQ